MAVGALFTAAVALVMPAFAAMRPVARSAIGTMPIAPALSTLADTEHGVAVRRNRKRFIRTTVLAVSRWRSVGALVAIAMRPCWPFSALSAFASVAAAARMMVLAIAVTTGSGLGAVMLTPFRHRQSLAANVGDDFKLLLHHAFDSGDFLALSRIAQRNRDTAVALAGRAADAVHVGFRIERHVEVDDVRDVGNVDAARRDVGRDEHANVPHHEVVQRTLARVLRLIAVKCRSTDAGHAKAFGNAIRAALRARENDDALAGFVSEDRMQPALLFRCADDHDLLIDAVDHDRLRREVDAIRFLQNVISELLDFDRHGRGEERRAPSFGKHRDDFLDVANEAHVEHAVGFVEHERLNARQIARAHVDEIEQTAGRRDEHVHAAFQRVDLRTLAHAAENDSTADAHVARQACNFLVDLDRKLARRRQHERQHLLRCRFAVL